MIGSLPVEPSLGTFAKQLIPVGSNPWRHLPLDAARGCATRESPGGRSVFRYVVDAILVDGGTQSVASQPARNILRLQLLGSRQFAS